MKTLQRLSGLLVATLALGCASLPSVAGEVRGVRAEYFNMYHSVATFPTTQAVTDRIEDTINVNSLSGSPAPNINDDEYMTRYTGFILVPASGTYTFQVKTTDGSRLYVDCDHSGDFQSGELLVDKWQSHSSATTYSGSCTGLVAGQRYAFRYEFYRSFGISTAVLSWSGPSPVGSTAVVIPKSDGSMGLTTDVTDSSGPLITSAEVRCGATTSVEVVFSEQLDSSSAQTAGNYSLSGGYSVTAATLRPDRKTVWLTVSPAITGTTALTVSNVGDVATPMNAITGSSSVGVSSSTGIASGLNGTYYDQNGTPQSYYTGNTVTRTDSQINFLSSSGSPVGGIPADYFSARWKGLIQFSSAGSYGFSTSFDNGGRVYLSDALFMDNWDSGGGTTAVSKSVGYEPITVEFYEGSGTFAAQLKWTTPGSSTYVAVPANRLYHCVMNALSRFTVSAASSSCSTCACTDIVITLTAVDASGNTFNTYTGTVTLSTSSGRGDWSAGAGPAPSGTLDNGTANDGAATYTFAPADLGVVKLKLTDSAAQNLVVTASDTTVAGSSTTTGTLSFRDHAFSFAEDAANKISGSDIAVAGRPHNFTVSVIKKDPSTGSCGIATDYTGSHLLKLWRSDSNGSWTAPTATTPATTALTVPASQPASGNVTMAFTSGAASLTLGTTDIGRYGLSLQDDSLSYASTTVSGDSNTLTVRPFAIVVQGLTLGGNGNPGGSAATEGVFGKAGSSFQATVGAYRWQSAMLTNGTDANDDGLPDSGATLANTTAGGLAPSFSSTVALSALASSHTPTDGRLGTLSNGSVAGFSGGSATPATLKYSEAGSFALSTSGVVSDFLGSGLSLDATVFNASGVQSARVGRFTPAYFSVSSISLTNRINISCTFGKFFTYLGENFQLKFTLTAMNADDSRTRNYTGSFAKLDPSSVSAWNLGGVDGSTSFLSTGSSPRLSLGTAVGSWGTGSSGGFATAVTLSAAALRGSAPDGPFTASFGIAPVDSDGVAMGSYDLDADSSVSGYDRKLLTTVSLQYGRLKLSNAVGSQGRVLNVPLTAQTWSSGSFATSSGDHCTTVPPASFSFGNHRKTLTAADTTVTNSSSLQLQYGVAFLKLAAPSAGHSGTVDVALSLDGTSATDNSCLQPWTPAAGKTATQGANLAYLRGGWCGATYDKDPAARAAFGVFHGTDRVLYQRENP